MRAGILIGPLATGCLFLVFEMSIRRQRWVRKYQTAISYGLLLLFIPVGIFSAIGAVRLLDGIDTAEFHYSQASEMENPSSYDIPPNAKQIDIYRNGSGHVARFVISSEELEQWVTALRASKPELDVNRGADDGYIGTGASALFEMDFGRKGFPTAEWKYQPNMRCYHVGYARNGAGFKVWYATESQMAYLRAFYW